jgi:integrase
VKIRTEDGEIRLKYLIEDVDRHGNVRIYFRRKGQQKIRLREKPGTAEFQKEYNAAKDGQPYVPYGRGKQIAPGRLAVANRKSLRWLCILYFDQCGEFKLLQPTTRRRRRALLERVCEEHGDKPYALMRPRHVRQLRDEKTDTPTAGNAIIKALKQVFNYAVEQDLIDYNPVAAVKHFKTGSTGFHTWTIEEIEQYEQAHPVGTKARLAMALLLYTAQRRSDIVQFGRQHVKDGWLHFTQFKNRERKPVTLSLPIIDELQKIIDTSPVGDLAFLVTDYGRPFTTNGFGNKFRQWCNEANLPHCASHGLRKAAAVRLAELGCSDHQIMAVTGHVTTQEMNRYTKGARQKVLAEAAMKMLSPRQNENKSVPLEGGIGESGTIRGNKPL